LPMSPASVWHQSPISLLPPLCAHAPSFMHLALGSRSCLSKARYTKLIDPSWCVFVQASCPCCRPFSQRPVSRLCRRPGVAQLPAQTVRLARARFPPRRGHLGAHPEPGHPHQLQQGDLATAGAGEKPQCGDQTLHVIPAAKQQHMVAGRSSRAANQSNNPLLCRSVPLAHSSEGRSWLGGWQVTYSRPLLVRPAPFGWTSVHVLKDWATKYHRDKGFFATVSMGDYQGGLLRVKDRSLTPWVGSEAEAWRAPSSSVVRPNGPSSATD
jgi:hypothetical protein